jgi:monoamine oxidase
MDDKADIVIVGAGISGLFAARELSKKGKKVIILEAGEKAGGRIRSISGNFTQPVDAGAEFIHGNMPLTKALLEEAGSTPSDKKGKFYTSANGKIFETEEFIEDADKVMFALKSLTEDIPLIQFLETYFGGEQNAKLRKSIINLAEGFDAADANRLSSFAVRDEWAHDSINDSKQISNGYMSLILKLADDCRKNGVITYLFTEVSEIDWQPGYVVIKCSNGKRLKAEKVLVTVPLGVLLSSNEDKGHIRFLPDLPEKIEAAKSMGYGAVIKVNFEFKTVFWHDENFKDMVAQIEEPGFLNSEEDFPVWWTTDPELPFLTGWVGGSKAEKLACLSNIELCKKAICSLARILNTTSYFLKSQLHESLISNWKANPYYRGAYSYDTPESSEAKKILALPVADTVYFAGEALGESKGTVESALESAKNIVRKMEEKNEVRKLNLNTGELSI